MKILLTKTEEIVPWLLKWESVRIAVLHTFYQRHLKYVIGVEKLHAGSACQSFLTLLM
jgi:hypothetical protein